MKELTPQIAAMYLGCKVIDREGEIGTLANVDQSGMIDVLYGEHTCVGDTIKNVSLILRRLSSMSEEEAREVESWRNLNSVILHMDRYLPEQFQYLLSKGFDLFGLIDAGLAVEPVPTK